MQIPWFFPHFSQYSFFSWPSTKFPDFSLTFAKSGISLTFPWPLDTLDGLIEVGCRGFIGRTTTSYLTRLGLTNRARQRATQQLPTAAERASSWIWSKVRKSTTVWQNSPPSSLLPYPHPTPTPPSPHPLPPSPHHLHPYPLECIQSIP